MWIKVQEHKALFWSPEHTQLENFATILTQPGWLFFEVYKFGSLVGVFYFTNVHQLVGVQMHGVMFDRTLTDKVALARRMIHWMFERFPLERVEVSIAQHYRATMRYLDRVGFKFEGVKRKAIYWRGTWQDEHFYSMTREDL